MLPIRFIRDASARTREGATYGIIIRDGINGAFCDSTASRAPVSHPPPARSSAAGRQGRPRDAGNGAGHDPRDLSDLEPHTGHETGRCARPDFRHRRHQGGAPVPGSLRRPCPCSFPTLVFGRFIPCAIAAGDTFIFRQARRSPCLMQDIREMLMDIGLPAGAVGVVHGGAGAAGSRYEDEHIAGV